MQARACVENIEIEIRASYQVLDLKRAIIGALLGIGLGQDPINAVAGPFDKACLVTSVRES